MTAPRPRAHRASILHFGDDPASAADAFEYLEDGLLLVEDGRVARVGPADALLKSLPGEIAVVDHRPGLIVPRPT
jgi:guanine deaminase